ncbi:hypothetical protein LguiB_001024 [Lonicera macranthoides]
MAKQELTITRTRTGILHPPFRCRSPPHTQRRLVTLWLQLYLQQLKELASNLLLVLILGFNSGGRCCACERIDWGKR